MKRQEIMKWITILGIGIIIGFFVYWLFANISQGQQEKIDQSFINGTQQGALFAVQDILRVVSQCQEYPVQVSEEQTINLIMSECLQNG